MQLQKMILCLLIVIIDKIFAKDVLLDCGNDILCRKIYTRSAGKFNNLLTLMEETENPAVATIVGSNQNYLVPQSVILTHPLLALISTPPQREFHNTLAPVGFTRKPWQHPYNFPPYYKNTRWGYRKAPWTQFHPDLNSPSKIEIIPAVTYALPSDITTYHQPDYSQNYLVDGAITSSSSSKEGNNEKDQIQEENLYTSKSYSSVQYFHPSSVPMTSNDFEEAKEIVKGTDEGK